MKTEKRMRREIFDKVRRFYLAQKKVKAFVPGKTAVPCAGRVYNEKEMVSLIDASLDFWLTAGRYARKFEQKFAEFLGVKYCLLANSGSSANLLAISALTSPLLGKRRLMAGDEVITTACGFPTTLNPIIQNNLFPVFVDIEIGTNNIDVRKIEKMITNKTKAIFAAHTLGNPAEIGSLLCIVRKYKLWFIEDNCDALGSKYQGRYTGTFGHISTCSFYPAHHITMGEGGAVLTNDPLLRKIILSFRDWGRDCWCETGYDNTCKKRFSQKFDKLPFGYDHKYVYSHIGYNLKVTEMQAAIGVAQLQKLKQFISARKKNFNYLLDNLQKYEGYFVLPHNAKFAEPCWFGFPILIKESAPFTRNQIVDYLEENKISTRVLFGGNLVRQPAYKGISYKASCELKNTDTVMNNLFWIGVYPGLRKEQLEFVSSKINDFFSRYQ